MREPRAEARVGAVEEASTAAREGACAPRDQSRQTTPLRKIGTHRLQARRARSDAPYLGLATRPFDLMGHFGIRFQGKAPVLADPDAVAT
jgi:hypothetical protein